MDQIAETLGQTILLAGHYGSGKTNIAMNLAVLLRRGGQGGKERGQKIK